MNENEELFATLRYITQEPKELQNYLWVYQQACCDKLSIVVKN